MFRINRLTKGLLMKLTKKMLRKMILEEANVLRAEKRQQLSEYGSGGLKNPGD